ncbi:MAG TPA: M56 family metallopeptidase [Polyangia bacterium]|jgi:beta-lactamase regulating signal transducer with metallopeptidase domain|nr:M56 family metallopeptidase [Polyangia bacterium]
MREFLSTVAIGVMVAWCALPLLAGVAAHGADEPSSRQRVLSVALVLGALLVLAPWLRGAALVATALPLPRQTVDVTLAVGSPWRGEVASTALAGLGALWLGGLGLALLRALAGAWRLRSLCRAAVPAEGWLSRRVADLAEELAVPAPRVAVSPETMVPFVTGLRRPLLVFPAALLDTLDEEALDLALRHELVHVARADVAWAVAVAIARLPLVLHPTARWLGREIALAREEAVDAIVSRSGAGSYAHLLIDVAALAGMARCPHALVSMEVSSLERRIARLCAPAPGRRGDVWRLIGAAALLLGLVLMAPRLHAVEGGAATAAPPPAAEAQGEAVCVEESCEGHCGMHPGCAGEVSCALCNRP